MESEPAGRGRGISKIHFKVMKEANPLLPVIESIAFSLQQELVSSETRGIAFYGKPPTDKTGDLDLLIISEGKWGDVEKTLQRLANEHQIKIDTWLTTPEKLRARMKRVVGKFPAKPSVLKTASTWDGFAYVLVSGENYLRETIEECYNNPEFGGLIPPTPEEHNTFEPTKS